MDVAFQSRIQVGIGFKELTSEVRQKIWAQLLDLNSREGTIEARALQNVMHNVSTLAKFELNGRQIRNVLNIAGGYAFNEFRVPGKMDYHHIIEAVKAAIEFQKFFEEARLNLKTEQSVWAPYRGGDSDFF